MLVYSGQNATLLEISYRGSVIILCFLAMCKYIFKSIQTVAHLAHCRSQ